MGVKLVFRRFFNYRIGGKGSEGVFYLGYSKFRLFYFFNGIDFFRDIIFFVSLIFFWISNF